MKLPNIFKAKNKVVILLNRDKADFYIPVVKTKTTLMLGSIAFKTTEAEFGEIINKEALAIELVDFLKSKQLTTPQVYVVLGNQIVFKGESKEVANRVPIKEVQKAVWQKEGDAKTWYVYNTDYLQVVKLAVKSIAGKMAGEYVHNVFSQADFAKEIFFGKQAKSLKLD